MKNVSVLLFIAGIILILGLFLVTFQVRENEKVVILTFNNPTKTIETPSLYIKWPDPIQRVVRFDCRGRLFEQRLQETSTRGGEPIIVTSYLVWKVGDPQLFLEKVGDESVAEDRLGSLLGDTQNAVIGKHDFSEFVNSDPAKIKFEQIEAEMLAVLKAGAEEQYGIEIDVAGIKQIGISQDVTKDVFERMKADRTRKRDLILTQGLAEATRIVSEAQAKSTELLSIVEARATAIRGEGDAKAAEYYELLKADPEFALFLRKNEALGKMLKQRTTIILGAENELIKLLREMPDIKPAVNP